MKSIKMMALLLLGLTFHIQTFAQSRPWQGSWSSTFRELRLIQEGNRVYGDYGNLGTIEGSYQPASRKLEGISTNGNQSGRFSFTLSGSSFTGKWAWGSGALTESWTGRKKTSQQPVLTMAQSDPWEGSFRSTFGTLKFVQEGNKVYGDYRDLGPIEGTYDPTSKKLRGTFDNKGQKGRFEFVLNGRDFTGKWAWGNLVLKDSWTGTKTSSASPILKFPGSGGGSLGKIEGNAMAILKGNITKVKERPSNSPKRTESTSTGYVCVTREYEVDAAFNENFILSNTSGELFPGNIIDGVSFSNGQIRTVNGQRKAYTLSASLGAQHTTVNNPSISGARSAIQRILPNQGKKIDFTTPANLLYERKTIKRQEDLKIMMQAAYDDGINKIKASGGYSSKTKKNVVAVRFMQLYFTADVDKPANLTDAAVFSDGTRISNDMLMVSQVGYGRYLLFLVETDYSEEEIKAALDYVNRTPGQNISAKAAFTHKQVIDNSVFNVYIVGGGAADAMKVINNGEAGLKSYFTNGAEFSRTSPGAPIFYKLRFLKDWSPANTKFSTVITKTDCKQTAGAFDFSFDWAGVVEVDDPGNNEELYGIGWCRLFVEKKNGQKVQVMPENFTYKDKYGRVFEILPQNYRSLAKGDATKLMNRKIRFRVDAADYGYVSFAELARKAHFKVVFEAKESDAATADDVYPKVEKNVYLNQALIRSVANRGDVIRRRNSPDFRDSYLYTQLAGSRLCASFSIIPVSEVLP